MIFHPWILLLDLRTFIDHHIRFSHDERWYQVVFHQRNRQSILTDQNLSLSREGTIVCYRSVNEWYILQRIVRCGERGDVRSTSCLTKDLGVSTNNHHVGM